MRKSFFVLIRVIAVLWLSIWAATPWAAAQSPPDLGLSLYAGVTITGAVGAVYAVQATSDVAQSNGWMCLALVQLPTTNYVWADTSKSATTGQRFYRTALTATNLVYNLPGTFTMGAPTNESSRLGFTNEAQHLVTISRGFWMGKYLVTQGDYLSVIGSNPSYFNTNNGYALNLARPVEFVTWTNAANYCALRTQQEQAAGLIPTNYVYRLPTESEWEYACRAGTTTAFYLGVALQSGQANFNGQVGYDAGLGQVIINPSGIFLNQTSPVGSYAPNGWGLYDMIGNVYEWCQDWYGPYPTGSVTDPQGAVTGNTRVLRGGSWDDWGQLCRSAYRVGDVHPNSVASFFGFRVVLATAQP